MWLQTDAQQGWPEAVAAGDHGVQGEAPHTDVKVQYQTWPDHLTKLDAALAGSTPPDVVELGNTETTKYMAAGALAELKPSTFDNSSTWLKGLADAGSYDGATYAVPYYAGSRAVIYNTALYSGAGVTTPPTSFADLTADADKLMAKYGNDKSFSAFYVPGKYWYQAMSWVYDNGGQIAKKDGDTWTSTLSRAGRRRRDHRVEGLRHEVLARPTSSVTRPSRTPSSRRARSPPCTATAGSAASSSTRRPATRSCSLGSYPMPSRTKRRRVDARVPRRVQPRGHGQEQGRRRRGGLDRGLHQHRELDRPRHQGRRAAEHDLAAQPRQARRQGVRRRGEELLVRARRRRTGRTSRRRT